MDVDLVENDLPDITVEKFCSFITELIKSSLPLSLFHFAFELDSSLSPLLPKRDEHITSIVNDVFKMSMKSNQLRHYLSIFKQAARNENLAVWHSKDKDDELNKYAKKKNHSIDTSHQYCSPIQIDPPESTCPKYVAFDIRIHIRIFHL